MIPACSDRIDNGGAVHTVIANEVKQSRKHLNYWIASSLKLPAMTNGEIFQRILKQLPYSLPVTE